MQPKSYKKYKMNKLLSGNYTVRVVINMTVSIIVFFYPFHLLYSGYVQYSDDFSLRMRYDATHFYSTHELFYTVEECCKKKLLHFLFHTIFVPRAIFLHTIL